MKFASILKSRFITHTPLVLTHLVTSACNARCKSCDLWKKSAEYKSDMPKECVFEMIDKAKTAGMVGYVAWGGEPLMRKDLPEVLQYARKSGLLTTVITNGFFLKDRFNEIAPFIDFLIVSIDSNDKLHDKMRGVDGIFERAVEGIRLCKKGKIKIIMNCVISKLNLGKVGELLELSKELGISITFEPMEIIAGYNERFRPSKQELKTAFSKIITYKKAGYRIGNSMQYLRNFSEKKQYVCHAPKCYITVDAKGNIIPCSDIHKTFGNVKNKSFKELFGTKEFKGFCREAEKCSKCNVSCVIESSLAYSLNPLFYIDKLKSLR